MSTPRRRGPDRADWYFETLRQPGAQADVRLPICHHPLAGGAAAVVEWFKGGGLRPFLRPLDEAQRTEFLRRYEAAVARLLRRRRF